MQTEQARQVLGVGPQATAQELRTAYLEAVRRHPPDRSPEVFEQVRDAYDLLRDPRQAARRLMEDKPASCFAALLGQGGPPRPFLGPEPWLALLREAR